MKQLHEWFEDYRVETVYNRAIPHIMDGFKPIHRKIYYTALNHVGINKLINTAAFAGTVKAKSNYLHGDTSIESATNNLAASYKNNLPMFIGEGNFGSKQVPEPAAPRYTEVKLNPKFTDFSFLKEILEFNPQDDNNFYDPSFYFFKIPMVLVNGIYGIAVGMSTNIIPYRIEDIKENIINVLKEKSQKEMKPYFSWFKGKVEKINDRWYQIGKIEQISSTVIHISELTDSYILDTYKNTLEKMKEKGIIIDYDDGTTEEYDFTIKVTRKFSEKYKDSLLDVFKMIFALNENINVLDETGRNVLHFDGANELIDYYVKVMLKYIDKFIEYKKKYLNNEIEKLLLKMKFVEYISSIDLRETTTEDIKEYCFKNLNISNELFSEFMKISIAFITKNAINKYKEQLNNLEKELKYFQDTTAKEYYLKELENI
jgi:DNA topoisomerase-2